MPLGPGARGTDISLCNGAQPIQPGLQFKHPAALLSGLEIPAIAFGQDARSRFRAARAAPVQSLSFRLGHSTFTLTLDVYGDYIPEADGGAANNLPEPPALVKPAELPSNVISLFGAQAN